MSRYIPPAAVQREYFRQLRTRAHLERQLESQIERLKGSLRVKTNIASELKSLGLTQKHAETLNDRLKAELRLEERLRGETPEIDPAAIRKAADEA